MSVKHQYPSVKRNEGGYHISPIARHLKDLPPINFRPPHPAIMPKLVHLTFGTGRDFTALVY